MDPTIILWTGIGTAALGFAFLDYRISMKKRVSIGKIKSAE